MIIEEVSTTLKKKCMTIIMELLATDRSYSLELVKMINSYKIGCSLSPEEVEVTGIAIEIVMADNLAMIGMEVLASFRSDFMVTATATARDDKDYSEVVDSSFAGVFKRTLAYKGEVFLMSFLLVDNLQRALFAVSLSLIHNRNHLFHDLYCNLCH